MIKKIVDYEHKYHFLSHGRLVGDDLIFVENNKNVKKFSITKKTQSDLYSHSSSIVAFDVINREGTYSIISCDFNGNFKEWRGDALKS